MPRNTYIRGSSILNLNAQTLGLNDSGASQILRTSPFGCLCAAGFKRYTRYIFSLRVELPINDGSEEVTSRV